MGWVGLDRWRWWEWDGWDGGGGNGTRRGGMREDARLGGGNGVVDR